MKRILSLLLVVVVVVTCLVSLNNYHIKANNEDPVLLKDGWNFATGIENNLGASDVTEVHFIKTSDPLPTGYDVSADDSGSAIAVKTGTVINIYSNSGFKLNPTSNSMFATYGSGQANWVSLQILDFGWYTDFSEVTNADSMFKLSINLTTIIVKEDFPVAIQNSNADQGYDMFSTYSNNIIGGNGTVCGAEYSTTFYDGRGAVIDKEGRQGCLTQAENPGPEPTPTPAPSKPVVKDESCEKVIGPSWHWNNDKGVCEDYGVVGTSTR